MLGVELVKDRATKEPAKEETLHAATDGFSARYYEPLGMSEPS